jgi:hypothetical protein
VTTTPPTAPDAQPPAGSSAQRGALRRRLARLRSARDRQVVELGTLVLDAKRRTGGSHPEVVERRAAQVAELDRQVRELAAAVEGERERIDLRTGIASDCRGCGAVLATDDRFCPSCGTPSKPGRARPVPESAAAAPPPAAPIAAPPPIPGTEQKPGA